jgi:hypothetical protein
MEISAIPLGDGAPSGRDLLAMEDPHPVDFADMAAVSPASQPVLQAAWKL